MPMGTFTIPCTHKDLPLWGTHPIYLHVLQEIRGLQLGTNLSSFLQLHNLQAVNRTSQSQVWMPRVCTSSARHLQPPAGRKHHPQQHRLWLWWGSIQQCKHHLMLLSSLFCLPAVAGFHASFTLLFKLPLFFVCLIWSSQKSLGNSLVTISTS